MVQNLLIVLVALSLLVGAVLLWWTGRESPPSPSLAELQTRILPSEGQATAYGIPLSWDNVQRFADWYYEVHLSPQEERVLWEALHSVPTPCCDDTRLTRCCCEEGGLICNLVRSARGLAAWLIHIKGFNPEEVRAAVEEWLRLVHPGYYLAQELRRLGQDHAAYGLATQGACYRGACEDGLRAGGCGGMGSRVRL